MPNSISQFGGATIGKAYAWPGLWSIPWPGAHLSAGEDGIVLRFLVKRYYVDRASVSAIRQYDSGLPLRRGVQLLHTKGDCPPDIVFWTMAPKQLIARLRQLGFPVSDEIGSDWKTLKDSME